MAIQLLLPLLQHLKVKGAVSMQPLKISAFIAAAALTIPAHALNPWHSASYKPSANVLEAHSKRATQEHLVNSSPNELKTALDTSPILSLPLPDGTFALYRFSKNELLPKNLAKKYPNITTYTATDISNPQNTGNFTLSNAGLYGLFNHDYRLVLLDQRALTHTPAPHQASASGTLNQTSIDHTSYYVALEQHNRNKKPDTYIKLPAHDHEADNKARIPLRKAVTNDQRTTYTIAVSATGEYTQAVGGTKSAALSQITRTLSAVNTVYERDLNMRFNLADGNDKVIFTKARTDPFSNTDANADIDTNQNVIDDAIGLENVDLAHVFATGGGGLAINGVCENNHKAKAISGFDKPISNYFYISLVAHEIGHQLGASHTFNGTQGACEGGNRNGATAWEPGSGSTIMAYAGLCKAQNLPTKEEEIIGNYLYKGSDKLFHIGSIEEMKSYTNSEATCGVKSTINNSTPTADAGSNYSIPVATSFKLTGKASDADGDSLTYIWEQFQSIPTGSGFINNPNDLKLKPLFRSYTPTTSLTRHFPSLSGVMAGKLAIGESYATVKRSIDLNFTVRDGKGGVATDQTTITTNSTCPFAVLSPTASSVWQPNTQNKVLWDTAGSNKAPINCAKVDISLDTGDASFSRVLLTGTPNDGAQLINVPNLITNKARIMVSCSDNVFYAVNMGDFKIANTGATKPPATPTNLENTCANPITTSNPSTTPPTTETAPSTPSVTSTSSGSTSSGGSSGGGAMPAWLVLLMLTSAYLSACKAAQVGTSGANNQDAKHSSEQLAQAKQAPSFDLAQVADDVQVSITQGDFRLWATTSRAPYIVSVAPDKQKHYQTLCGVRYLPHSGDHLSQEADMSERNHMQAYASAYNQAMLAHCR